MPFDPTLFVDLPEKQTPITAAELNKLGSQYASAVADVTARGSVLGSEGKNYRIVAGVLRNTGSGFAAINDAGHVPVNIASVSTGGAEITINYGFTAKKVISFIAGADETFADFGYVFGSSVGMSSADIRASQPGGFADYVSYNGTAWVSLNGYVTATTMNGTTGLIQFTHQSITLDGTRVGGVVQGRSAANRVSQEGMTDTTTQCLVYPFNSSTSVKTLSTDLRFWITRSGARKVPPAELVQSGSNIWVVGLFEVD